MRAKEDEEQEELTSEEGEREEWRGDQLVGEDFSQDRRRVASREDAVKEGVPHVVEGAEQQASAPEATCG